jgi:hypothetical protein
MAALLGHFNSLTIHAFTLKHRAQGLVQTHYRGEISMTTSLTVNRRSLLQMAAALPLAGAALYGTGLIGAGALLAATNKPVVGVGIKVCKNPGGSSSGCGRWPATARGGSA